MENKNLDGLDPAQRLALARGEEAPQFTAVDVANADADGYRNGRASVVVELPERWHGEYIEYDVVVAAIIAAGGKVKE